MTDPFPELPKRVLFVDVKPEKFVPPKAVDDYFKQLAKPRPVTKPRVTKLATVTKIPVTKPKDVTKCASKNTASSGRLTEKNGVGRPAKGDRPMTAAERKRQSRAAKKVADHAS